MTESHESHALLSFGLAACIVLASIAIGLGVWNAYWHTRIKDQVEQVVDASTPSFAEAMPEQDQPTEELEIADEIAADAHAHVVQQRPSPGPRKKTETRVLGGREFQFAVESPGAADPEAEAVQDVPRGGSVGSPGVAPRRAVSRPPVPSAPQRPEA